MPKRQNAYAFRDFDGERILQRPFFRKLNLPQDNDEKILKSLQAADDDSVADMEKKFHRLEIMHEKLVDYHHFICRHQDKLNRRSRARNIDDIVLGYFYATLACVELTKKISTLCTELEKQIQSRYRTEFAIRLKSARQAAGLTQRQLADMIQISPTGFAQYEQGRNDPSLLTLSRVSKILKVSSDELLGISP